MSKLNYKPHSLLNAGMLALDKGEFQVAIDSFKEILNTDDRYTFAYYHLANVHIALQQWEKAEHFLDIVRELEPEWPFGFYNAGKVAILQGYYDDAVAFFSLALKLGISSRNGLVSRGIALHGCGRLAEAIDDFDLVLTEALDVTALQYRMACLVGLHRYKDALCDIDVLIEVSDEENKPGLLDIRNDCKQQLKMNAAGECIEVHELAC